MHVSHPPRKKTSSEEVPSAAAQSPGTRDAAAYTGAASRTVANEASGLYRLLVESVKDYAIFALDTGGHIISWNAGAERFKGYTEQEILGKHYSIFYPAEDAAAGKPKRLLEAAIADGRVEDEGWRVRKDGTRFWADVVITALRDETGTLVGFAKVTRDLSERRAAEQRAIADARRIAQVESSNRAKSDFLAAMSHELRTPLNAIGGYAELIEMGVAGNISEQQKEYLTRIRNGQRHLLGIINDLLNFSRIESGQVTYELEDVDAHAMVDSVIDLVQSQATLKGIEMIHGPCPKNVHMRADRLKTEQIVLNILSNAVKFTPEGGKVTTTCGITGEQSWISVSDTGPGIPEDKRSEIFEPFVQLGRTLSSLQEGTGLGLAISRDLARAMNGNITIETAPGGGANFTVFLPGA
jgi:PAS domain S-box-containing protein